LRKSKRLVRSTAQMFGSGPNLYRQPFTVASISVFDRDAQISSETILEVSGLSLAARGRSLDTSSTLSGGHTARVRPVPIPNTEVKPRWADDTVRVTAWERRSPPG